MDGSDASLTHVVDMVPALIPFGLGLGFVFGPLFNVILAGVDDREVGSASGTLNAIQQLGNAIGVAVLGDGVLLADGPRAPARRRRCATPR